MNLRRFLIAASLVSVVGCANLAHKPYQKADEEDAKPKNERDANDDVSFKAFLGTLREAVAKKDMNEIASVMTPDFAYYMGTTPADDRKGPGVFQYWDQNGLWPELEAVVNSQFKQHGTFMVAPKEFADNPDTYHGYRIGISRLDGAWKFVYFVTN